jgi:hypothetical protein
MRRPEAGESPVEISAGLSILYALQKVDEFVPNL